MLLLAAIHIFTSFCKNGSHFVHPIQQLDYSLSNKLKQHWTLFVLSFTQTCHMSFNVYEVVGRNATFSFCDEICQNDLQKVVCHDER